MILFAANACLLSILSKIPIKRIANYQNITIFTKILPFYNAKLVENGLFLAKIQCKSGFDSLKILSERFKWAGVSQIQRKISAVIAQTSTTLAK